MMTPFLQLLTVTLLLCRASAGGIRRTNGFEMNVTFSDDGLTISLPPFLVQLFETDGDLPDDTNSHVAQALDTFLLAELNAVFAPDREIEMINTTVVSDAYVEINEDDGRRALLRSGTLTSQERIAWRMSRGAADTVVDEQSFLRGRRSLDTIVGSELEMLVNVTFDRVPAPTGEDVNEASRLIMADLDYFLANLTVFNDAELENVRLAFRREIKAPTPAPIAPLPTSALTSSPTSAPTVAPTSTPSSTPTQSPTSSPTPMPSSDPTSMPTSSPTAMPTPAPTPIPTLAPTATPSAALTIAPSAVPTPVPSPAPVEMLATSSPAPDNSGGTPTLPTLAPMAEPSVPTSPTSSPNKNGNTPTDDGAPSTPSLAPSTGSDSTSSPSPTELGVGRVGESSGAATRSGGSDNTVLIVAVTAGAALVALIGLFLVRRQRRSDDSEKNYADIQSDLESLDRSMQSLSISKEIDLLEEEDNADSVFMGLESESQMATSPRIRANKTGLSFSSATTLKATNAAPKTGAPTPMSLLTVGSKSLFAFSEEEDEGEDEEYPEAMNADTNGSQLNSIQEKVETSPLDLATPPMLLSSQVRPPSTSSKDMSVIQQRSLFTGSDSIDGKKPTPLKRNSSGTAVAAAVAGATAAGAAVAGLMSGRRRRKKKELDEASRSDASESSDGVNPGDGIEAYSRRHTDYRTAGDGTALYQTAAAVQPLDWSYQSMTEASDSESTLSEISSAPRTPKQIAWTEEQEEEKRKKMGLSPLTSPLSHGTAKSRFSKDNDAMRSPHTAGITEGSVSDSRQLINDLVWLEKKIADVRKSTAVESSAKNLLSSPPGVDQTDSLSFASKDAAISPTSNAESATSPSQNVLDSIVCRDCVAPPGMLNIVIHSTKDGPAVHTIKEGSSLEGHLFPGDLIIAVDGVDTRTYSAEQVMKMMANRSESERKITVLHFDE